MFFLNETRGWVTAYGGSYFQTNDGGKTWEKRECPNHSGVCGEPFFTSPTHGYLSVGVGLQEDRTGIMETIDGLNWNEVSVKELSRLAGTWQYGRYVQMLFNHK